MLYKKIDSSSVSTITSALNFFETPPTNVSIGNSSYREYLTLNPINSTPFHFKIHPISSFIDPSKVIILNLNINLFRSNLFFQVYLFTEMCIKQIDNEGNRIDLSADDIVAPIQLIGSTFIKNLKININGRDTFDSNGLYAYKTYFDTELSYPTTVSIIK